MGHRAAFCPGGPGAYHAAASPPTSNTGSAVRRGPSCAARSTARVNRRPASSARSRAPLRVLETALSQLRRDGNPPTAVLYFHPWEFDPQQPRLPLGRLSRFRTYVGQERSRPRLVALLRKHRFVRAIDAVAALQPSLKQLPAFDVFRNGQ